MNSFFITGTDTGVGKTLTTAALLHAYAALGLRVAGMKPVAAGAERAGDAWSNEDVAMLIDASNVQAPMEWVNPYLFREPIAPHIAAERKGTHIEFPRIRAAREALAGIADVVLVEGVGGFLAPLTEDKDAGDLAALLDLPVILVVGLRLGCLNHALLTQEAILRRGLRLTGWVANRIDPTMLAAEENLDALVRRLHAPLLADIPWIASGDARRAAGFLPPKKLAALLSG